MKDSSESSEPKKDVGLDSAMAWATAGSETVANNEAFTASEIKPTSDEDAPADAAPEAVEPSAEAADLAEDAATEDAPAEDAAAEDAPVEDAATPGESRELTDSATDSEDGVTESEEAIIDEAEAWAASAPAQTEDAGPPPPLDEVQEVAPKPPVVKRQRSAEDDVIVATVIFVTEAVPASVGEKPPTPWTLVGAVPILRRTFISARLAGMGEVKVVSRPALKERIEAEARKAQLPITLVPDLDPASLPERGRIVILDACANHDVESLQRLQKWKGGKACLVVSNEGDGMRVQLEGVRIRELGRDLVPFDAFTAGALSVPVELAPRLLDVGMSRVLKDLVAEDLLGASAVHHTRSRELRQPQQLDDLEATLLKDLGRVTDGLADRFLNRKLSLAVTRLLYDTPWIGPSVLTVISCLFGLLAGPLLALTPRFFVAPGFAAIALWISLILDRVDGEIARLRLETTSGGRVFGRVSKLLVHGSVLAGIMSWFDFDLGVCAAGGALLGSYLLATVASLRQPAAGSTRATKSLGDHLDGFVHNRNYLYLTAPLLLAIGVLGLSQADTARLAMTGLLGLGAACIGISGALLLVLGTKRDADARS